MKFSLGLGIFDRSGVEICYGDIVYSVFSKQTYKIDFGSYIWHDYEHTGFFLVNIENSKVEPLGFTRISLDIIEQ